MGSVVSEKVFICTKLVGKLYSRVPAVVEIAVLTVSIALTRKARLILASARVMNSGILLVRSLLSNQFAAAVFSSAKVAIDIRRGPTSSIR